VSKSVWSLFGAQNVGVVVGFCCVLAVCFRLLSFSTFLLLLPGRYPGVFPCWGCENMVNVWFGRVVRVTVRDTGRHPGV